MAGLDWNSLGNDIHNMVQDAVNSRTFEKLNSEITRAVDKAFCELGNGMREVGKAAGQAVNVAVPKSAYRNRMLFTPTDGKMVGAFIMAVGGFILAGIFGISFLLALLGFAVGMLTGGAEAAGLLASGIPLMGSLTLGTAGTMFISRIQRFRRYIDILGNRTFCDLKELAAATGKSLSYVQKDLKKLVKKNWFRQGYFDRQGTCLMVTNDIYQQYLRTEQQRELLLQQEQQRKVQSCMEQEGLPREVRDVLEAGEAYVKRIRKCNDDIPGVEISNKIFRIEELVQQIFARVKAHPETVTDIRRMMEYYLPTTIKLLDAYAELDAQSVQGEHITRSKQEIEQVLDTLNVAFEKLLDSLFRDKAWDVSADISVLQTMLAQEGLTESDFRRESK